MNKSTCSFCGYQWLTGQDGDHSCSQYLLKQLTAERARSAELERQVKMMVNQCMPLTENGCIDGWSRVLEAHETVAQRDKLASHLEFAVTMLTVAGLGGNAQVNAMRSALSAICTEPS